MKTGLCLFSVQFALYAVLCVNFRAVAEGNYLITGLSDALIAAGNFYIIRKIANEPDNSTQLAAYVAGSVVGSLFGIWLSVAMKPFNP